MTLLRRIKNLLLCLISPRRKVPPVCSLFRLSIPLLIRRLEAQPTID